MLMMNRLLKLWAIPSPKWRQSFAAPATATATAMAIATYAVSAPSVEGETEKTALSREGPEISYGLNSALAGKGVIVQEKAFRNLTPSELQQKEPLLGLPVYVRGKFLGGSSEITKAEFSRLLKQVTTHISSISDIFVHDGAIGSFPKIDAKVRVISDSSSAVYPFSDILWKTSSRAVSHDSCPITVYAASSISSSAAEALGLGNQGNDGFIAADAERSSLILCGKAFADVRNTKEALAALAGPIISSRGGLLLSARILGCCDSVVLLFATEDTIRCSDLLVSADSGVVLSPHGVFPLFQNGNPGGPHLLKLPAAIILVTSDSSRVIPPVSKLSSGQVAYHFLAGYQNGKFIPAYGVGLSCIDPVELAKALFSKLKDYQIPSFLINANEGEKRKTGADLVNLVQSTLKENILPFKVKGGGLRGRYKNFLSGMYPKLPKEFSF